MGKRTISTGGLQNFLLGSDDITEQTEPDLSFHFLFFLKKTRQTEQFVVVASGVNKMPRAAKTDRLIMNVFCGETVSDILVVGHQKHKVRSRKRSRLERGCCEENQLNLAERWS